MTTTLPISLLCFNINDFGNNFDKALKRLPDQEHKEILRYKFEKDRRLALASRLLRRYYYATELNIPWETIQFSIQPGGKPTLALHQKQGQWMDFNISHDGDWVIFGATEKNNMSIGVDVVSLKNETYGTISDFIYSFHDQLTYEERKLLENIKQEDNKLIAFFQIWGLKESYIKAHGKGLSIPLNGFYIDNDNGDDDSGNAEEEEEGEKEEKEENNNSNKNDTNNITTTKKMQHFTSREQLTKRSVNTTTSKSKKTRLKLHRGNQSYESYWCVHLSYLDTNSVSVICCGDINEQQPIDNDLVLFAHQSLQLGDFSQQTTSVFKRLQLNQLCSFS
ncbi:hypothetical protein BJ944DRAFT_263097 [Cunninghamella echinulata]|nr:hypothetical protein BJ944DRAFT_263097 [Cunninghamella echinulata]